MLQSTPAAAPQRPAGRGRGIGGGLTVGDQNPPRPGGGGDGSAEGEEKGRHDCRDWSLYRLLLLIGLCKSPGGENWCQTERMEIMMFFPSLGGHVPSLSASRRMIIQKLSLKAT